MAEIVKVRCGPVPALALCLTSVVVAADPKRPAALTARRHALEKLVSQSGNSNESGRLQWAWRKPMRRQRNQLRS